VVDKPFVTIAVLAKELGLGKATISLALRDDPRIRKETRERVQRHADKRGYAANPMVAHVMSQLRSAKVSNYRATIALINVGAREDTIRTNVTFRTIADGFRRRAAELGYLVEDLWIGDKMFAEPERLRTMFQTRRIEGMGFLGVAERALLPEAVHVLLSRSVFVGLGIRLTQPLVHCCANDQYMTAVLATRKLLSLGFARPGLVVSRVIDRQVDGRFRMGFRRSMEDAGWQPAAAAAMAWNYQPNDKLGFGRWLEEAKPDVLLCTHTDLPGWLKSLPGAARNIALAHLDWDPSMQGWAGMNQHNDLVGAFGVDLLTAHLARRDLGLPQAVKTMCVESEWVDGRSLRPTEFLA
jgi:LacI family transcriptional regulator